MHLAENAWYGILAGREVPTGRPVAFRRLGHDLVFWRDGAGAVRGALDRCPHRWARLSPGKVVEGQLECPFHGFRFDGSGACTAVPAHPQRRIPGALAVPALVLREAHGFVWAWTGPDPAPDGPVPFFDFTGFSAAGSDMIEPVANHYTRAVENQLDWPHLPFVHANTIGRGLDAEMEIETEVEGDLIRSWRQGRPDGGRIELRAPNLWRLRTGPAWQFLVFAPVDDQHMQYYARSYQPFVTVPGLDWLVGRASAVANRFVLRQDSPPVESQPVGEARLRSGELLVPSDGPIIAWRRWREERRRPFVLGTSSASDEAEG